MNLPTEVKFNGSNTQKINYTYSADGTKLKKVVNDNGAVTTTDYASNYVYENNVLKQITQPEGYIEPDGNGSYQYVYQLKDIWGNTRITFADDNNDGAVTTSEIRREQNYYPFGLEHKGYNNVIQGVKNNLKQYQGQEFTEDLGLNTHEWKYRISDPAIGRFWQIDPLAEDYVYNSTYAFQENKMGMGTELEGLELRPFKKPDGSSGLNIHFKVLNSSTSLDLLTGNKGNAKAEKMAQAIVEQAKSSFSGNDADGNNITVNATYEMVDEVDVKNDFYVEIVDIVKNEDGSFLDTPANGKIREIGNTESNRVQISALATFDSNENEAGRTGAHEIGHAGGLTHESANGSTSNLMIEGNKSNVNSTNITSNQRSTVMSNAVVKPVSEIKASGINMN